MRQRESTQFAELLNRLREGKQTNEDIRIFSNIFKDICYFS